MSSLVSLHQDHALLFCQLKALTGTITLQHHWSFNQHMFTSIDSLFDILIVRKVGSCDIDSIHLLQECVSRCTCLHAFECTSIIIHSFCIDIIASRNSNAIHNTCLQRESISHTSASNHAHLYIGSCFGTKHSTTDTLGTRKINHLGKLIQVVKQSFPIRTDGKDVHIILLYVINLLTHIVLDDDLICITGSLNGFHTLQHVVAHIELTSSTIKGVACHTHDKVVTQLLCSSKEVNMTLMKQVVCSVCYYFFH